MNKIEVNTIEDLVDLDLKKFIAFLQTQSRGSIKGYKDSLITEFNEVEVMIKNIKAIMFNAIMLNEITSKEKILQGVDSYACLILSSYKIKEKVEIISSIEEQLKDSIVCHLQAQCINSHTIKCENCGDNMTIKRSNKPLDYNFESITAQ